MAMLLILGRDRDRDCCGLQGKGGVYAEIEGP